MLGYSVFRCIDSGAGLVEIDWIWVAQGSREKGIARRLIASVFDRLGPETIWLEVSSLNREAIQAYEKMGFVPQGVRRNYYRDGSSAILMELKPAIGTFRQGLVSRQVS